MELRDWLMAAGAVLVLLILIDGWRRINGGSDKIRLKIDPSTAEFDSDSDNTEDKSNPELPNGGARVKRKVERPDIDALMQAEAAKSSELDTTDALVSDNTPSQDDPLFDLHVDDVEVDPFDSFTSEGVISEPRKASIPPKKPSHTMDADPVENTEEPVLIDESLTSVDDQVSPKEAQSPFVAPPSATSIETDELAEKEISDPLIDASIDTTADKLSSESLESSPEEFASDALTTDTGVEPTPAVHNEESGDVDGQISSASDTQPSTDDAVVLPELEVDEPKESQDLEPPKPLGHVDDLFGLDLDRPIHELVDAGAQSDKPARQRKAPRKKQADTRSEFDELLGPRAEVTEPLQDIESLVSELPEQIESTDVPEATEEDALETSASLESSIDTSLSVKPEGRQVRALDLSDPETSLVVFVVAAKEHRFSGDHIRTIVERCGMEFGQMNLFHRFEDNSDSSHIQFTMSNAGEPGSFDIDTMDEMTTPAVTFFMSMTEPRDPSYAVDCMLATAETLAKALQGEMLDSDRSVMRPQTQEHYRELVKAYKLRSRAKTRRVRKSK